MEPGRIRELLSKYSNSETTLAEERELKKYFTEEKEVPSEFVMAKGMFTYFHKASKIKYTVQSRLIPFLTAACVLILAGLFISNRYLAKNKTPNIEPITFSNESGKIQKITLADKNVIWLNTKSEIVYPNKMAGKDNHFIVNGEVYFEILHPTGSYTIKANHALIKAEMISSFNIKALDETPSTEIAVDSGAVKIYQSSDSNSLAMIVRSGYYCSVHNSQKFAFTSALTDANYKSWKTHEFKFINTPMATVVDVLTKYYNIPIELENRQMAYCEFSGTFREVSLDEVLKEIETELNYSITNSGVAILLSGKNCF